VARWSHFATTSRFSAGELEHEVPREAAFVAFDLLVEALGGDGVDRGQVGIEDDLAAADRADDRVNGCGSAFRHGYN
jgi:hypothetical protein